MFVVRAEVVQLAEVKRTVEGRTLISSCDVVGEPEPTIEWRRSGRLRPYVLGAQPVSNAVFHITLLCRICKYTSLFTRDMVDYKKHEKRELTHTIAGCQNDSSYDHAVFTGG